MALTTFVPKKGTDYSDGWPVHVVGDGFINLTLSHVHWPDSAMYTDQFREEYEFWGKDDGEWTVEVRED